MKAVQLRVSHVINRETLQFCSVGAATMLIYFGLFSLITEVLHWDYRIALTISYFTSSTFQFTINRTMTFKSRKDNVFSQMIKYIILFGVTYAIAMLITVSCVSLLHLNPYIGVIAATTVTVLTSYLASKYWVYS